MERLDALLDSIGTAPQSDPIDALLADLDRLNAAKDGAQEEPSAEKWVFRRD